MGETPSERLPHYSAGFTATQWLPFSTRRDAKGEVRIIASGREGIASLKIFIQTSSNPCTNRSPFPYHTGN
ncbi:hypothetical protein [Nostoc sp.]|uniref:hypothetical protein n=1 Tax=Nostoc sp. TaxID=1180 RepID=UPI002FF488F0